MVDYSFFVHGRAPQPPQHVDLKARLLQSFEAITAPGSFAAWEALPTTPPAGLFVDGVGQITMPLGEGQIRNLIKKAHQAPYGRRSETLVDLSVRNTWEINGDQLFFLDPTWQGYLLDLSKVVASKLGINGPIRVLLITGMHSTEKTPGMFGTMIICLPSAHTGGEVVARHNGEVMVLSTSDAPQSFACWYSDVSHEVLPVQSGYRCVLTYNLATWPDQTRPAAGALGLQKEPLKNALQRWLRDLSNNNAPSHLYHTLDHEYTEASVSLNALKAKDSARVHALQQLTRELPFEIFLVLLEKELNGGVEFTGPEHRRGYRGWGCVEEDYYSDSNDTDEEDEREETGHHKMTDIFDTEYTVLSLCTLDGATLASEFPFDTGCCLVADPFESAKIDQEEYEPYMGNSGPSATHWYRRSALLIVPRAKLGEFLAQSTSSKSRNNLDAALDYIQKVLSHPSDRNALLDAMSALYESAPDGAICRGTPTDILKTALQCNHLKLFRAVGSRHNGALPIDFFDWVQEWFATLPESERIEKYQGWLPSVIEGYPSVADRIDIIAKLSINSAGDAATLASSSWAQDQIHRCIQTFLKTTQRPERSDVDLVMSALFHVNEASAPVLLTSIFEHFTHAHSIAFLLGLLSRLKTQGIGTYRPNPNTVELYRNLSLHVFNRQRKLSEIITPNGSTWSHCTGLLITPQDLVQFACDLFEMGTDGASSFIQAIIAQCKTYSTEHMRDFWMPFLYQLIPALVSRSVSLNAPVYQQLTRHFIKHLDDKTVGAIPCGPGSVLAQNPQVHCGCPDCGELNKFLRTNSQRVGRFRKVQAKRTHLEKQITRERIACTCETERGGSPLTLIVVKCYVVQEQINAWQKRQKQLYSALAKNIHKTYLQCLLSDEEATRIQSLAGLG
ncbi:hypothetical protein PTTG_26514 [Puccinia triticina 1-1 BBBD Race 1]|uniref:Prolyl 4-hydroxylase alpha subunit Fe(2+) 2OG dioxygenase domain-containing protein n=2 Tax=Puccinia triticina (isolate 1-1 / race 1 (BBBD)) TaxID=630390 RepID=A0A180GTR2_PUCT1|nr:hypothetical protein PTTG_26514 [Puccinia triticina 1-1 BBBD Race 1]